MGKKIMNLERKPLFYILPIISFGIISIICVWVAATFWARGETTNALTFLGVFYLVFVVAFGFVFYINWRLPRQISIVGDTLSLIYRKGEVKNYNLRQMNDVELGNALGYQFYNKVLRIKFKNGDRLVVPTRGLGAGLDINQKYARQLNNYLVDYYQKKQGKN